MSDLDTNSLSVVQDLTGAQRVGSDEFFFDVFGVNMKGLKSIWTLIVRPVEYFEAARLPDWGGDHWPSIRIWMGLMGILVALQFIWASESSEMTAMFQMLATMPADATRDAVAAKGTILDLSALDREALGKQTFKRWVFIYPFFFVGAMCFLALIFRAWKPAASFVIRLRFIFAIIVPTSVFGLLSTLALVNVSGQVYVALSFISLPVMVVLYAVTAYRGPFHDFDTGERVAMSMIVAVLIMISLIVAQFVSMLIASAPTWIEVTEIIKPQIDAAREAREAAAPSS